MIEALGHRLTIRADKVVDSEAEELKELATKAGFVLPSTTVKDLEQESLREQAAVDQGIVLTIGKTAFKDFGGEPWCAVGDYVAYAKHAGRWVKDPDTDENILVLNDEDVICRITEKVAKDD